MLLLQRFFVFDQANQIEERQVVQVGLELVAALRATHAADDLTSVQPLEDLHQERQRQILSDGDLPRGGDRTAASLGQVGQGNQGVIDLTAEAKHPKSI